MAALCPDFDKKLGLCHRGFTHSLAFIVLSLLIPPLGLGVALHVLFDLLTPTGCRLTKEWYVLLGAPLRTGVHDALLCLILLGGLLI